MTGWREALGVPVFIEGEINSRFSLCVLLGRQWGILTADEKKSETHPTASIRLDSRDMKSNFCKEFICFSLPNALEMITYEWMVHWMSPAKNWDIGRILGTLVLLKSGRASGKSCSPWRPDLPGLQLPSCDTGRRSLVPHPVLLGPSYIWRSWHQHPPYTFFIILPLQLYLFFFFWLLPSLCCYVGFLYLCWAGATL